MTLVTTRTHPLTGQQASRLKLTAMDFVTFSVARSCPSLERRGLVERYRYTEHGRSYVDWRITAAGQATADRLHYDPAGKWPVYCAFCGEGLYRWYLCLRAPMCPQCHERPGPVMHPARWEVDPHRVNPGARGVWEAWAETAQP